MSENIDENETKDASQKGLFPIASKWFTIGFYIILGLWALYLLYETFQFSNFEDYALPFIMLATILILTPIKILVIIFPEINEKLSPGESKDPTEDIERQVEESSNRVTERSKYEREKYELIMIGWVILLPITMYVLGLGWTVIIYVFSFTWFFLRDLKSAIIITAALAIFTTILFLNILNMIIWPGLWDFPDPLVYLEEIFEMILSLI